MLDQDDAFPITRNRTISFVATSRNDNHGGDVLRRTQSFVNGLARQCERHKLTGELVLVDWNPPAARAPLADVIQWPASDWLTAKVVTVPHALHLTLPNARSLPMFQMIAKNVGIRRASGDFIIATNIDILFSDELFNWLGTADLENNTVYRSDRWDIPNEIQLEPDFDRLLDRAQNEAIRKNLRNGTHVLVGDQWMTPRQSHLGHPFLGAVGQELEGILVKMRLGQDVRSEIELLQRNTVAAARPVVANDIHANGCGDFTMFSAESWHALRGNPEWPVFSWNIDSAAVFQAVCNGFKQVDTPPSAVHFHIEHGYGSGYTPGGADSLWRRMDQRSVPVLTWEGWSDLKREMEAAWQDGNPVLYNGSNWGFADHDLPVRLCAPSSFSGVTDIGADPVKVEELFDETGLQSAIRSVSDVKLLQGTVSTSCRTDDRETATLDVETGSWHHAAIWQISEKPYNRPYWIRCFARLLSGGVRLGILNRDDSGFLVEMLSLKPEDGRREIVMHVPPHEHPTKLLLSNLDLGASRVEISDFDILWTPYKATVAAAKPREHATATRLGNMLMAGATQEATAYWVAARMLQMSRQSDADTSSSFKPAPPGRRGHVIAFLNPWTGAAENQAYESLKIGAERVGCKLVHASTSDELLACAPDFAIAVASTQAKTTSVPTFGAIHEPRTRFLENEGYLRNLLTYDGYLTVSESLEGFLQSLCAGLRRRGDIGFYYNTPQVSNLSSNICENVEKGQLRLCYFGTNWDRRNRPLFRRIANYDYTVIHGPNAAWDYLGGKAYGGEVAFDGISVQARYAECGVGLVVLSREHLLDDVISNRIFEITSVGAVAICPDIPWIRQHFGDSVFYYVPAASTAAICQQIDEIMSSIKRDSSTAALMGRESRRIFESRFAAERMIENAVLYFERWQDHRTKMVGALHPATIDVIVRVGGRPIPTILRTIESLEAQTTGDITVIFVRYREIDLSPILQAYWKRIKAFRVVDEIGGHRASTLCAGLKQVRSQYFALLDDDDFLLDSHFDEVLQAGRDARPGHMFSHSGLIHVSESGEDLERRSIRLLRPAGGDTFSILGAFGSNTFLASSELLEDLTLDNWNLKTGEDSALIGSLILKADVSFTFRATACASVGRSDSSNFETTPTRPEDVLEWLLRVGPNLDLVQRKFLRPQRDASELFRDAIGHIRRAQSAVWDSQSGRIVMEEGAIVTRLDDRDDVETREVSLRDVFGKAGELDHFEEEDGKTIVRCLPPPLAWTFGVTADLSGLLFNGPQWVVVELTNPSGTAGVGVLDETGKDYEARAQSPGSLLPQELWLMLRSANVGRLVFANWSTPLTAPITVRRIWIVREKTAALNTTPDEAETAPASALLEDVEAAPVLRDMGKVNVAPVPAPLAEMAVVGTTSFIDRDDIDTREIPLRDVFRPVEGPGFLDECDRTVLRVLPSASPWAFGAMADLSGVLFNGPQWVVVEMDNPGGSAGVGVFNADEKTYEARAEVPSSSMTQEVRLMLRHADVGPLIVQNWASPVTSPITVRKLWLVREKPNDPAPMLDEQTEPVIIGSQAVDIAPLLRAMKWVRYRDGTFIIGAGAPQGHVIYGPYLPILPGRYEIRFEGSTRYRKRNAVLLLECVVEVGTVLKSFSIMAKDLRQGPLTLSFEVPEEHAGAKLETRFSHFGLADIELTGLFLRRVDHPEELARS